MIWAPVIGLLLGGIAAGVLYVFQRFWHAGPLLGATLAIVVLAALSGCLHLDGLADFADGLGSRQPAAEALAIMRRSDIGPFGVAALVLTLLLQVTALSQADALGRGVTSVIAAAVTGRLALTWACRRGVPAARSDGLGALVAGTVHPAIPVILSVAALAGGAAFGLIFTVAVGGGTGCLAGGDLARRPPPRRHHRRCARRRGRDRHRRLPRGPRAELVPCQASFASARKAQTRRSGAVQLGAIPCGW